MIKRTLGLILIVLLVVGISGCTSSGNNSTSNTTNFNSNNSVNAAANSLEQNIVISNVKITPASYGKGYDTVLTVQYNGDKPINGRLGIEPVPMYGNTEGNSELGEYKSLPNGITKGKSFKIEMSDVGGFTDDPSGITGIKFRIGAEYTAVDSIYSPEEEFYTQVYPVKK